MSSPQFRRHAGPPPARNQPMIPEPSFADRARTLMYANRVGYLSTLSLKQRGFPFGSLMPYALDDRGRPIFLISTMAMHTHNLQADPRASLLVTQPDVKGDPLGFARVTLIGNVAGVQESEVAEAKKLYLAHHPHSKNWVEFEDFFFHRMEVVDVYYVGGFGVMGWVSAAEYYGGRPDPLVDTANEIIQHMNADHSDALVLLTKKFAGIDAEEAKMTSVDRLGLHVRLKTKDGVHGARIAFLREANSPAEARNVLIEMLGQARQA